MPTKFFGNFTEQTSTVFRTTTDNKVVTLQPLSSLTGTSATFTFPDISGTSDTLLSKNNSITLTNKNLEDSTTAFVDNVDTTKQFKFEVSGLTTATTRTWTVPNFDDTLAGVTGTQSFTNKTITDASNNLSATILTSGLIPDARVPASNVTQHEASLTLSNQIGPLSIAKGGTGQITQTAAFDALSPNTTKGDLIANNGTNDIRVPVGTDGFVLSADSGEASGIRWIAGGLTNPMDSPGDLIVGGIAGAATKLDSGAANTLLTNATADTPSWSVSPTIEGLTIDLANPGIGGLDIVTGATNVARLRDSTAGAGTEGFLQLFTGGTETIRLRAAVGDSYINSGGNFGFGTTTPGNVIDVKAGTADTGITVTDTTDVIAIHNLSSGTPEAGLRMYSGASETIRLRAGTAESYFNAGNLAIGKTSASVKLDLTDSSGDIVNLESSNTTTDFGRVNFKATNLNMSMSSQYTNTTQTLDIGVEGGVGGKIISGLSNAGVISVNTAHPLILGTSAAERMRITSAGLVGIGKTPTVKLDLTDGSAEIVSFESSNSATDLGQVNFKATVTNMSFNHQFTNTTVTLKTGIEGTVGGKLLTGITNAAVTNVSSNHPLIFGTNNTERVRVLSTGEVGIGTTSPSELLHIDSTTGNAAARINSSAGGNNFAGIDGSFGSIDFRFGHDNAITNGTYVGTTSNDAFHIRSNNTVRMTFGTTGANGIGTTSPSFQLEMGADSAAKPGGGSWTNSTSDSRLKNNIINITDGLTRILSLLPKSFTFINQTEHTAQQGTQYGFMAQDIESVYPEAVVEVDAKGPLDQAILGEGIKQKTYGFNERFFADLVSAIKELNDRLAALEGP